MSAVAFGTDGIRGVAGTFPVTPEVAVAVGRAAARLAAGGRVLVARDTRPSSTWLACCVSAGAVAQGAEVGELGPVTTPMLGVALAEDLGAAGVMVTASHNPWPENGFKLLARGGRKPDDALAREIEAWIPGDMAGPSDGAPGQIVDLRATALERWERRMEAVLPDRGRLAGLRVALDLANGGACSALSWLRWAVPAEWHVLGDGGLPNDGVGSEHPDALIAAVKEHGCAAGLALDGDGDRCVLVDEEGRRVDGDAVTWLLARDRKVEALAVTVMSNAALEEALPGVRIVRTPVGDRHLRAAMDEHGLPLGAEESGHVLFGDFPAGDGLLAGLRALVASVGGGQKLSEAVAPFRPYPRRLTKVRVARRPPLDELPGLSDADRTARARLGTGRTLLRYSGTEPFLRILVEGPDEAVVEEASRALTAAATAELT